MFGANHSIAASTPTPPPKIAPTVLTVIYRAAPPSVRRRFPETITVWFSAVDLTGWFAIPLPKWFREDRERTRDYVEKVIFTRVQSELERRGVRNFELVACAAGN